MATVFEKFPISGNCLILDPKEAYLCPLDFGDWNQIRVSAAYSFTSVGNNGIITSETIAGSSSPNTSMFIGLYSGDGRLPFQENTAFVGFGNGTGVDIFITNAEPGGGQTTYAAMTFTDIQRPSQTAARPLLSGFSLINSNAIKGGHGTALGSNDSRYFILGNGVLGGAALGLPMNFLVSTGSSNFCVIETQIFTVVNKGLPGQSFNLCWSNNGASPKTNTSIDILKSYNANIAEANSFTGLYYNSNLTSTGSPVSLPDNLLIYFPFVANRARIHSVLVEKYA